MSERVPEYLQNFLLVVLTVAGVAVLLRYARIKLVVVVFRGTLMKREGFRDPNLNVRGLRSIILTSKAFKVVRSGERGTKVGSSILS